MQWTSACPVGLVVVTLICLAACADAHARPHTGANAYSHSKKLAQAGNLFQPVAPAKQACQPVPTSGKDAKKGGPSSCPAGTVYTCCHALRPDECSAPDFLNPKGVAQIDPGCSYYGGLEARCCPALQACQAPPKSGKDAPSSCPAGTVYKCCHALRQLECSAPDFANPKGVAQIDPGCSYYGGLVGKCCPAQQAASVPSVADALPATGTSGDGKLPQFNWDKIDLPLR